MSKGQWTSLGKDKLASSGLTTKDAAALGMYEVNSCTKLHKSFKPVSGLVMPYKGLDGKPLAGHPNWPNFYRVRYLGKGTGFGDIAGDKTQRYAQEYGTGVCAYLPLTRPWAKIAKDTTEPILITEGELKAAAACKYEYNCIGLGGVWNFRAASKGFFFLPELDDIDWVKREVFICYDSDYIGNPAICAAINAIGEELMQRGALVYVVTLPDVLEDGKTGLDDFLLHSGDKALEELIGEAEEITVSRALWKINKDVMYVEDPGMVIVADTGQRLDVAKFKEHSRYASVSIPERKVNKDGAISFKKVAAAPIWVKWPLRRQVSKVTYEPGQPVITKDGAYNGWQGWGVEPEAGSVTPWLELTRFIFAELTKEQLNWFYDWCAYPLQNPGVKMFCAVCGHGLAQVTANSFFGYRLATV